MPEKYDEKKMSKIIRKQEELEKERIKATKQIIKNLEEQKIIEREHLDLVMIHLKYWNEEVEMTNAIDTERLNELKDRLKMEKRVQDKIKDHMMKIDKEIKIFKEHIQ
jgi:hypothetical protein